MNPSAIDCYRRGLAGFYEGDIQQAIVNFTEGIRLDPDYAFAWWARGIFYRLKGDYDQAIKDCGEAIKLNPVSRSGPGAGPFLRVLRGGDYIDSLSLQANVFNWTPNFNRLRSAGREAIAEDISGTTHPGAPGFRVVFNLFGE